MARGERPTPSRTLVLGALAVVLVAASIIVLVADRRAPVPAGATRSAPSVSASTAGAHSVTFIGDSWTFGEGATALRGYAVLTGEGLGWRYRALGIRGSGYDIPPREALFDERVDRAVGTHPDVIVVQGSLNEMHSTPQALATAADRTLAHLKAAASAHTRILVLGSSYAPGVPDATIDWINADLRTAATALGLPFVDPAAENWTDPRDAAIWSDPYHPNDVGHRLIADHLEPLLRGLVGRPR